MQIVLATVKLAKKEIVNNVLVKIVIVATVIVNFKTWR
jgi:hypothetical protein